MVFNSNLAYTVKLFTENTTTKQEKFEIMKKFDNVTSLKESQKVYKSIVNDLSTKKGITEAVEEKLEKTYTAGHKTITENTVYVDSSNARIIELMKKTS